MTTSTLPEIARQTHKNMEQLRALLPGLPDEQILNVVNAKVPGVKAEVEEGYCNTDRHWKGSRLRHPGKGRHGTRIIVKDAKGARLIDHNSAEPYRTNSEVLEQVERLWGRIWENDYET